MLIAQIKLYKIRSTFKNQGGSPPMPLSSDLSNLIRFVIVFITIV